MKKRKPMSVVKRSESSRKGWRTRKALAAARKLAAIQSSSYWTEGYDAWSAGHASYKKTGVFGEIYGLDAVPYAPETVERDLWERGWRDALEDHKANEAAP